MPPFPTALLFGKSFPTSCDVGYKYTVCSADQKKASHIAKPFSFLLSDIAGGDWDVAV
jgi:hypothetical protein